MASSSSTTTTTTNTTSPPAQSFSLITSLRYDTLLLTCSWNTWPGNPPSPFFLLPYHLERLVGGARDFGWAVALEALGVGKGDRSNEVERHGDGVTQEREYEYAPALERFRALCSQCADQYLAEHPGSDVHQPLKIRITLSPTGDLHASASPTPPRPYDLLTASTFNPLPLEALTINSTANAATTTLDLSTISFTSLPSFASSPVRVLLDTEPTCPSPFTEHKTTARAHYDAARARASIPPLSASSSSSAPTPPPTEILLHTPGPAATALISEGSLRSVAFHREGRWVTPPLSTGCLPGTVRRWLVESGRVVEGAVARGEVRVGEWVMLCNGVEGCIWGIVMGVAGSENVR